MFYDCDQGQVDPVVAIARDQSSVYLQLLMHETQPPSQFTVSTITRCSHTYGHMALVSHLRWSKFEFMIRNSESLVFFKL